MIVITLLLSGLLMFVFGHLWARVDACEIGHYKRWIKHGRRLALRLAVAAAAAYLTGPALFWPLLAYNVSALFLVFVPTLNRWRGKDRYYISSSNNYDRFFLRYWQGKGGKVAYALQVAVLIGAVVWTLAVSQ